MYHLSNICIICLKDIDTLQTVYVNTTEDAVKQMKYVLPEITLEPEIPVQICSICHSKLHCFCTFKKQCLENYYRFIEKFRELGNVKDQSFNAFPIETMYIKEEKLVDDDLINEAPEENNQINCITEEDTIKTVEGETISPGLTRNINEVSGITDDIKSFECKEQNDQRNNYIEDIYIKEDIINFEDNKEPNLYQELLSDIQKNEQDKNESVDLNINNLKGTVSNLISSDMNQKINDVSSIKEKIKGFECKICHKKFIQRSDLNKHIKIHFGIKDFECSICAKKFTQGGSLKVHMKSHTGVKDFECSICEKKFVRNNHLKVHMKTHTGVKDFHCSVCEKKFTRKSSLKMHMNIHTGVRDFECSICEKKFTQNNHMKLHMKTHIGVKDFQCTICDKKFTQNNHLKLHMKSHIGVKDLQCSSCDKKLCKVI